MKIKINPVKALKILGIALGTIVALLLIAAWAVNNSHVQNYLMKRATEALSEQLQTKVEIDSIAVNIFQPSLRFFGLTVEDQEHRKMLQMDRLVAELRLRDLVMNRIVANKLEVKGLDAMLLKNDSTGKANYQFLLDAFKKDHQTAEKPKKKHFDIDIRQARLQNIHIKYDTLEVGLFRADYKMKPKGKHLLVVDSLKYKTDNGLPRKNVAKPHRGYYDKGHLNLTANLTLDIDSIGNDTLKANLRNATITDKETGFDITDLHATINANPREINLSQLSLKQKSTQLQAAAVHIALPNKKEGRKLTLTSEKVTGKVLPKDISRAFAPALKNFSIPLNLETKLEILPDEIRLNNIKISTNDGKLSISASGRLTHLKKAEKKDLNLHFHVNRMHAKGDIKERIINQFAVKKLMMNQLSKLGNITYSGDFYILYKRQRFQGSLQTAVGPINFGFTLDNISKYLSGQVNTGNFQLGRALEVEKLGTIACSAEFKIDISKPRTAKIRRSSGGKLPIGTVSAQINDCSYNSHHFNNLSVDISSDGSEAVGTVAKKGRLGEIFSKFSYIDTDNMHKVKVIDAGIKLGKDKEKKDKEGKKESKLKSLFHKK